MPGITSDSLIAPTPPWMTFDNNFLVGQFGTRLCFTASTEPCTSAFTMIGSSLTFPALIWMNRSSKDSFAFVSSISLFLLSEMNVSAKLLASFSFSVSDEYLTCVRNIVKTEDLNRSGRACLFDTAALIVHHGTDFTVAAACGDGIADL